jgi:hypothetical protein
MLDDQAAPFGFIIFCLVVGVFLIIVPWHGLWESNFLLQYVPPLRRVMLNPFFRGAVSGLGAIDVALGVAAFGRLLWTLRFGSSKTTSQEPEPPPADHSISSNHPE